MQWLKDNWKGNEIPIIMIILMIFILFFYRPEYKNLEEAKEECQEYALTPSLCN